MFRWVEGTTPEQIRSVTEHLNTLPGAIGEIARYEHGADAGINAGNFDYVVVADFATDDDYLVYRDHPVHQRVIVEVIAPLIATRSAVQVHLP
jgi:hypothetical protein